MTWARAAGIKNWGYFIIGLPARARSIRDTIDYAKELPLDIALFTLPRCTPGTPFFAEVVENIGSGRGRNGKRWTWTSPRCWTTATRPPSDWNTG
ncbi:MAG: hypothetical protein R3A10_16590 [Caldilineaceae bacterium]